MSKSLQMSNYISSFNRSLLQCLGLTFTRPFTLSSAVEGKRSREPYDKRWGIHPKDASKKGGTRDIARKLGQASMTI